MKKLMLVGALALFAAVNAQTEKGSWVIGGSTTVGFNNVSTKHSAGNSSSTEPSVSTFTLTPSVGYFVQDKLAVGLDLGFVSMSQKDGDDKYTVNTLSAMPTATYYFKSATNLVPYLGAGVGYASTKMTEKYNGNSESETVDGLAWKAKGGLVYLINQNIGVDVGASYNQFSNKETVMGTDYKTTVGTFGINLGFSVFLK